MAYFVPPWQDLILNSSRWGAWGPKNKKAKNYLLTNLPVLFYEELVLSLEIQQTKLHNQSKFI